MHVQEHATRVDGRHSAPPPAYVECIVRDTGGASPRFLRATLNTIPATPDVMQTIGMPLAFVACPLALQHPNEEPVEVMLHI